MIIDATHLTSLFENATEGIILTNGAGNIVMVNPAAERVFGYNASELIGRPVEVLLPDKIKTHHQTLREGFYEHPSNRVMGHGRDLYGKRKDGSKIPVEVSLSFYKRVNELFCYCIHCRYYTTQENRTEHPGAAKRAGENGH